MENQFAGSLEHQRVVSVGTSVDFYTQMEVHPQLYAHMKDRILYHYSQVITFQLLVCMVTRNLIMFLEVQYLPFLAII